jgi:pimeloyl-ACP methyl ester carboxylesterase
MSDRKGTVPALSDETRALGDLAARGAAGLTDLVRGTHEAIAGRTFRVALGSSTPARRGHDAISRLSYATVRGTSAAAIALGGRAVAAATRERTPLADTPGGSVCLGALNGAIGDELERRDDPLAIPMGLRHEGRQVSISPPGLAARFPHATERIVVFVHGLCETERAWWLRADPERRGETYGARLEQDIGYTPLYVRYNTGLHVSDNGCRLARALEELVGAWPAEVEEIAVVGHSMGGLVARSACHYGEAEDHAWIAPLRHVFCLGTPHLGAPLEKAANVAGWALAQVPETRPLANVVNGRSAGIKDLRFGNCVEDDWCDCDVDEFLQDRCHEVPFLPTATYYFIGATLARDAESPAGSLVGDLLVRFPSASGNGRKRHIPFEIDNGRHLGGLNHFQLLNHPAVYEQIRDWLARHDPSQPAAGAPSSAASTSLRRSTSPRIPAAASLKRNASARRTIA